MMLSSRSARGAQPPVLEVAALVLEYAKPRRGEHRAQRPFVERVRKLWNRHGADRSNHAGAARHGRGTTRDFPSDFHKRCMYASFAIASLLEDAGTEAEVCGGDFLRAVVSTDGRQLSLQGFGTSGVGEPSHYWVHANGLHIDLGPAYLPHESPYPAPALPAVAWASSSPLPDVLAYRERVRVVPDATISDPAIAARVNDFVARCRARRDAGTVPDRQPFWLLRDMASLRFRAQRGDPWAVAAQTFLRRGMKATFPTR